VVVAGPVLLAWTAEDVARLVLVVVADVLAVVVETPSDSVGDEVEAGVVV